jgi:oxygen-dependent protoporphyrinogen oxidase
MVQFGLGHAALVAGIRSETEKIPGLRLTGPAFLGNGLPDCVTDAQNQAASIYSYLKQAFPSA